MRVVLVAVVAASLGSVACTSKAKPQSENPIASAIHETSTTLDLSNERVKRAVAQTIRRALRAPRSASVRVESGRITGDVRLRVSTTVSNPAQQIGVDELAALVPAERFRIGTMVSLTYTPTPGRLTYELFGPRRDQRLFPMDSHARNAAQMALTTACVRYLTNGRFVGHNVECHFNEDLGTIEAFVFKTVLRQVKNHRVEMTLEEARSLDPDSDVADSLGSKLGLEAFDGFEIALVDAIEAEQWDSRAMLPASFDDLRRHRNAPADPAEPVDQQ